MFCKIVRDRNLLHGNFHGYAIFLLVDSLPLLTQPVVKYGARKHAKERPCSFIRPELESSQPMFDATSESNTYSQSPHSRYHR